MKILMTGATGLIGKQLGIALVKKGHELVVVTRSLKKAKEVLAFPCEYIECDITTEKFSEKYCEGIDAIIHLAGDNIGQGLWTKKKKKEIYDSRINSTNNLVEIFKNSEHLKLFINMSAAGFYSSQSEQILDENKPSGEGFLSQVCRDWERALSVAKEKNWLKKARIVFLRSSMVLSELDGAFDKILIPFKLYSAVKMGAPNLWMSWIHIEDFIRIVLFALENEQLEGPVNCSAPESLSYKEFYKELEKKYFTFFKLWIPAWTIGSVNKSMLEFLFASQKVQPEKLLKFGFKFEYDHLGHALDQLLKSQVGGYRLFESKQFVPHRKEELFPFFAEAKNLENITPPLLSFKILSQSTERIQKDTKIVYKLKIHGLPVRWKTNIASWKPPFEFQDEQMSGPYHTWSHVHIFEDLGNGTLMTDRVTYKIPLAFLTNLFMLPFILADIRKIFDYRRKVITDLYK